MGADDAQVAALGSLRWGSGAGGTVQKTALSSVRNPVACGTPRAKVQEALGCEFWVQERNDSI